MSVLHVSGLWSLSYEAIRSLELLAKHADWSLDALVVSGISETGCDYAQSCYLLYLLQKRLGIAARKTLLLPAAGDLFARADFNRDCHVPVLRRKYRPEQPELLNLGDRFISAWDTAVLAQNPLLWSRCSASLLDAPMVNQAKTGLLVTNRALEIWNPSDRVMVDESRIELTCDPVCEAHEQIVKRGQICTPAGTVRVLRWLDSPPYVESALYMVLPSAHHAERMTDLHGLTLDSGASLRRRLMLRNGCARSKQLSPPAHAVNRTTLKQERCP